MLKTFFGGQRGRRTGHHSGVALAIVCGIAVLGALVMLLWNWLMPALFPGVGIIDYWQALGLLLLSKILLGGGRGFFRGHHHHPDRLTGEEREQLKRHFRNRWEHGERWENEGGRSGFHEREDMASRASHSPNPASAHGPACDVDTPTRSPE